MKKFILALLFIVSPLYAQFQSDNILTSPNAVWTDSRAYGSLGAAITAIGANERTIVIAKQETVTNLTIPSNITLEFRKDGSIANSGTLTLQTKKIIAPDRQIFTGTGEIAFASGTIVRSSWFSNTESAIALTSTDTVTLVISKAQTLTASFAIGNNVQLKWESPGNILTANAGVTISNIRYIEAGDYQLFAGAGTFTFVDGINLNLRWFNSLRAALTWINATKASLLIPSAYTVDLSDTIPSNITSNFDHFNGSVSVSAGITLTINGGIVSTFPPATIFTGAGTVTYSASTWFGGNLSLTTSGGGADLIGNSMRRVATLADLKALTSHSYARTIYLLGRTTAGDGGEGIFRWDSSDLSASVTADTLAGIYVPPDSDTTGAHGAWVRQIVNKVYRPEWFGAKSSEQQTAKALTAMATFVPSGGTVQLSGTYDCGNNFPYMRFDISNLKILGPATIIYTHGETYEWQGADDRWNVIDINRDRVYRSNYLIEGIEIRNDVTPYPSMHGGAGIWFYAGSDLVVRNCKFYNIPMFSICLRSPGSDVDRVLLEHVYVESVCGSEASYGGMRLTLGSAIDEENPEEHYISYLTLRDVRVVSDATGIADAASEVAFKLHNARYVLFDNCSFTGWDQLAGTSGSAMVTGSKYVTIRNTRFLKTGAANILYLQGNPDEQPQDIVLDNVDVESGWVVLQGTWGTPNTFTLNKVNASYLDFLDGGDVENLTVKNSTFGRINDGIYKNAVFDHVTNNAAVAWTILDGSESVKIRHSTVGTAGLVVEASTSTITGTANGIVLDGTTINGVATINAAYTTVNNCEITGTPTIGGDYSVVRNSRFGVNAVVNGSDVTLQGNHAKRIDVNGDNGIISGNTLSHTTTPTLLRLYGDNNVVERNHFDVPDINPSGAGNAYFMTGSTNNRMFKNIISQRQPQANAQLGIIDSGTGNLDSENILDINSGKKYQNWSATASVADGGTITHGIGTTPTSVIALGSVAGEIVTITSKGATTFTVAIKKHDGTAGTTQTIYWLALR